MLTFWMAVWGRMMKNKPGVQILLLLQLSGGGLFQGEGPPVCYAVKYMDCTVQGIGASKFPLLQQENLIIELLRAALNIS